MKASSTQHQQQEAARQQTINHIPLRKTYVAQILEARLGVVLVMKDKFQVMSSLKEDNRDSTNLFLSLREDIDGILEPNGRRMKRNA